MNSFLQDHELAKPVPLTVRQEGVIRVAATRVTLETVIAAFEEGATAEEIVQQYPSLDLADVYAVLGFYLRQRDHVNEYLQQRNESGAAVRKENERRFPPIGVRERLLAP